MAWKHLEFDFQILVCTLNFFKEDFINISDLFISEKFVSQMHGKQARKGIKIKIFCCRKPTGSDHPRTSGLY